VTATLYSYVNFIATYSLVISAVLITRDRNRIRGAYPALAFITCVLLYLIIDEVNNRTLRHLLVAGPSSRFEVLPDGMREIEYTTKSEQKLGDLVFTVLQKVIALVITIPIHYTKIEFY
jgi:hypothetical protein